MCFALLQNHQNLFFFLKNDMIVLKKIFWENLKNDIKIFIRLGPGRVLLLLIKTCKIVLINW